MVRLTPPVNEPQLPQADAIPGEVVSALARDPEAWTERFIAVVAPVAVPGRQLERQVQELSLQTEVVLQEIGSLRALIVERTQGHETAITAEIQSVARELHLRDTKLQQAARNLQGYLTADTSRPAAALAPDRQQYIAYQQVIARIRGTVAAALPRAARVLVVSRGDDELLRLPSMDGHHFPQGENGVYAGYYPANSGQAVAHLEALRAKGAEFILFPATAMWWLDHYGSFRRYLDLRFRLVVSRPDTCLIYSLAVK
jgi:hypothetical protein